MNPAIDKSQVGYARLAGLMYLVVDAAYLAGLFIIGRFVVPGNVLETAQRIIASEMVYRVGLSFLLLGALCTVFLAMGLYGTVRPIDGNLALLALVFRVVEATVFGIMAVIGFAFVRLYVGPHLHAFNADQLSALVDIRSAAATAGFNIAALFFSVGSILFFYLFLKSTYIPRILSWWGLLGSVLVPVVCLGTLIAPQRGNLLQLGWLPIGVAEAVVGLWLLIKGIGTAGAKPVAGA